MSKKFSNCRANYLPEPPKIHIYFVLLLKELWKKRLRSTTLIGWDLIPFFSNLAGNATCIHIPRPECQLAISFHSLHSQPITKVYLINPSKMCPFLVILIYVGHLHLLPELLQILSTGFLASLLPTPSIPLTH